METFLQRTGAGHNLPPLLFHLLVKSLFLDPDVDQVPKILEKIVQSQMAPFLGVNKNI